MNFREANINDIDGLHVVRMAVKENVLNNPALVTRDDYILYLTTHGKGWLCEVGNTIAGFAIIDTNIHNIWALFVHPSYEGKGIGRKLHNMMIDWYFDQHRQTLWLGTAPHTRADKFYRKAGWKDMGLRSNGEVRFEMDYNTYLYCRRYEK